jgi:putative phosphoribosyl transferase
MFFKDRYEASAKLAEIVAQHRFKGQWDVVGIARGGVVIAKEIAKLFKTKPKSICVEDFLGDDFVLAASSLGSGALFDDKAGPMGLFVPDISKIKVTRMEDLLLESTKKQERFAKTPTKYGPRIILCDDGIVSGRTVFTAVQALQHYGVKQIAVAIPVILPWVLEQGIKIISWRVSKMSNPSTGMFYKSFEDTSDEEVTSILQNG